MPTAIPSCRPSRSRSKATLPDDAHFLTRNFIVNIQQLKFAEAGLYSVDVRLDDKSQASIPLLVKNIPRAVA